MDKYEYRVRAEEINALIDKKEYAEAAKIADTIDWRRVKSVMMLCKVSDLYKINRRYEDSKEILLLAYDRHPGGRKIVYSLCELCIKLEEIVQAVEYYKEFSQVAPRDTGRFILQYRLYEAQDVSLEERIAVLEEYKKRDYREKWAYELAYLYHRIGLATRCVEECDELILWFGEGRYVIKAMELKMLHEPLTPAQQEKYDRYKARRNVVRVDEEGVLTAGQTAGINIEGETANGSMTLPISIKSVEVSNAPTAKIPAKKIKQETEEDELAVAPSVSEEDQSSNMEQMASEVETTKEIFEESIQEPVEQTEFDEEEQEASQELESFDDEDTKEDEDLDIQIKPIDVGEYNTINLQQELAKNLAKMLAEEDMEAMDATKALPIDTIKESTDPDLMKEITDDTIKNAIVAPLLQDTAELTPITEEDLLASIEEKPKTIEELDREEKEAEIGTAHQVVKPEPIAEQAVNAAEAVAETAANVASAVIEDAIDATQVVPSIEKMAEAAMAVAEEKPQRVATGVTQAIQASLVNMDELLSKDDESAVQATEEEAVHEQIDEEKPHRVATGVTQAIESSLVNMGELLATSEVDSQVEAESVSEPEVIAEQEPITESETVADQKPEADNVQPAEPVASAEETTEQEMVNEQITGQLSFTDIMAEWEETKKASEEKHREEMRQRMLKQTGPMFADFDATARASVSSNFDLITPMEDVFSDSEDLVTEVENALEVDLKENEEKEAANVSEYSFFKEAESSLQKDEVTASKETDDEPVKTKIFNTAEIRDIEKQLLNSLQSSNSIEPELVTPVITDTETDVPGLGEELQTAPVTEEPVISETSAVEKPIEEQLNMAETVVHEEVKQEPVSIDVSEPVGEEHKLDSMIATGDLQFTDLVAENAEQVEEPAVRDMNKQEKELFGTFVQTKEIENQITNAIDHITLTPYTGNVIISGMTGSGTMNVAKNLIKLLPMTGAAFSNKVAKVTGSILDKKDIKATFESLENGALIIEKAGDLTPHVCENIVRILKEMPQEKGLLLFMEDTRGSIDKLLSECPQLTEVFDLRIDIAALDNDGLVNYGKEYAKEQEYAIDDMGMLALYTRISDMQTNDHHVTIDEVKAIVDEAIANANKKSVTHLVDIIFAKRYDADDMIVLREKDFLKDR